MTEPGVNGNAFEITFQRSELIPGGNGARIAFSDEWPGKQFLIVPDGFRTGVLTDGTYVVEPPPDPDCCDICKSEAGR